MTARNTSWLVESVSAWFRDVPRVTASQWACQSFTLSANEGRGQGPFSLHGRQYLREIIDGFSDPYIEDIAACLGTQIGKTASIQAGVAYIVANDPCGILWVLPTTNDARNFSAERWMRNVMSSPELRKLVPTGAKRFDFAKANQQLGGTHIAFAGSNSPSGLAGRPRRVVILDEMEKFPTETRGGEAGSINLACQRTKDAAFPKRIRTSSPAMIDGPGWTELMKGDVRRRYVPCPRCGRFVILAWSKDHTELRITGDEAWMVWDKEARSEDGRWDFDRVERSARFECPGCGFQIREEHKLGLDAKGEWRPTQPAPKTWRSYHLPSWYAPSPSTTFGLMAVSFLQSLHGLEGLHGWLNGNAAEPWTNQSGGGARVEVITTAADAPVAGETVRILTVDCQQTSPHFYWLARDWDKAGAGHSRLVEAGTCEDWEVLRETQIRLGIGDVWVGIDSGWQASRVYQECLRWGAIKPIPGKLAVHLGWLPMKGRPGSWSSKDKEGNRKWWGLGQAALERRVVDLKVLEFSGDQLWMILDALRRRQGQHGIRWEAVDSVPDGRNGYWSQMDAKHSVEIQNRRTGRTSVEIHKHKGKQDHWLDCEVEQIAFAMMRKLLPWSYEKHGRTTLNQGTSSKAQEV